MCLPPHSVFDAQTYIQNKELQTCSNQCQYNFDIKQDAGLGPCGQSINIQICCRPLVPCDGGGHLNARSHEGVWLWLSNAFQAVERQHPSPDGQFHVYLVINGGSRAALGRHLVECQRHHRGCDQFLLVWIACLQMAEEALETVLR